jgi:hemerythrin-like domain-containing protein
MNKENFLSPVESKRREFLKKAGIILVAGSASVLVPSCTTSGSKEKANGEKKEEDEGIEVSPPEDLMREHGLLNRILLIYEDFINRLTAQEDFDPSLLKESAGIIRNFVEDYHEKLEEDHLFPRFEQAGVLTDLVAILRKQHTAGRNVTEQIIGYGNMGLISTQDEKVKLSGLLTEFIRMYRPHEAREDTVLFPRLHKIVTPSEFNAMGEDFENKEHELFGADGFDSMVDKVAQIEIKLGIHDLSKFTP